MNFQPFYPQQQPQQFQCHQNQMMQNQYSQQFQQFFQPSHENYQFQNDFPRGQDYTNLKQIVQTFEHLQEVNAHQFDCNMNQAKFFVLRSSNDDDIHKAIKYNLWTSTPNNNLILDKIFKECQQKNMDIYLFFSVVKSGQFIGVAKMASKFINKKFQFWWQNHKFNQQFALKWVYIKDVSYNLLNGVTNVEGNCITRSKDFTEIDFENGKKVLEIFSKANEQQSIFQDFQFMDMREDMLRNQINNFRQQKQQEQENL